MHKVYYKNVKRLLYILLGVIISMFLIEAIFKLKVPVNTNLSMMTIALQVVIYYLFSVAYDLLNEESKKHENYKYIDEYNVIANKSQKTTFEKRNIARDYRLTMMKILAMLIITQVVTLIFYPKQIISVSFIIVFMIAIFNVFISIIAFDSQKLQKSTNDSCKTLLELSKKGDLLN